MPVTIFLVNNLDCARNIKTRYLDATYQWKLCLPVIADRENSGNFSVIEKIKIDRVTGCELECLLTGQCRRFELRAAKENECKQGEPSECTKK